MNNSNGIASAKSQAPLSEPPEPHRPVSGTMARVAPATDAKNDATLASETSIPESIVVAKESVAIPTQAAAVPTAKSSETQLSSGEHAKTDGDHEHEYEDVTTVSTMRPFLEGAALSLREDDDDECTREYHDLPTRVMHLDESGERIVEKAPPSSGLRPVRAALEAPQKTIVLNAPPTAIPTVEIQASALVEQTRATDPLAVDRALLRVIASPPSITAPIVAMRAAPPSPRLLAVVATFTALGMLWVLAVAAMILSFVVR